MPESTKLPGVALSGCALVTFVPIREAGAAIDFYEGKLGFRLIEDQSPFALVFDLNGTMLRATFADGFQPQPFTVLGWKVADVEDSVESLIAAGVVFNAYPWMADTGPLPVWTAPGGTRIAWFNDPFGNVLSLQGA